MSDTAQAMGQDELQIKSAIKPEYAEVLNDEAFALLSELVQEFATRRNELLKQRNLRQARFDDVELPDFLPETAHIREGDWSIRGIPEDLQDRRVEITGPVERKMVINALNAGVKVFMADFEDSFSPDWDAILQGHLNLRDANNRTIEYTNPETGKHYQLDPDPALLLCRVRGLHLPEKHIEYRGEPIPGCLMDFALYFVHNHKTLLGRGSAPYYYIPKLQSHHEARWWSEVFSYVEDKYQLDRGTLKATVLIETLPAVFEMDEILYSMRDHIVALNCGRWDYIFSYIKTLKNHEDRVLPDRQRVGMDQPFLDAYSRLLVRTCHKRGALAMGGMAAFIPSKDPQTQEQVLTKVTQDKEREANNGHDGTWVAHPGLADTAMRIFNRKLGRNPNQMFVSRDQDEPITAEQLLAPCEGDRTEEGMRMNIRVSVQYIEAWISGNGCVPIYGLMEDAATAEISRASIWQWIRHGKALSNGKQVTKELMRDMLAEEMLVIRSEVGEERFSSGRFQAASELFERLTTSDELADFLTLPGYELLD